MCSSYIDLINKEITKVLALAPVAVLPEYQNQGIGSLLVKTGLEIAEKISTPMVIVLGNPKFLNFILASDLNSRSIMIFALLLMYLMNILWLIF